MREPLMCPQLIRIRMLLLQRIPSMMRKFKLLKVISIFAGAHWLISTQCFTLFQCFFLNQNKLEHTDAVPWRWRIKKIRKVLQNLQNKTRRWRPFLNKFLNLQSFTKHLGLTLVFMWNNALREKFIFCFSKVFCQYYQD